MAQPRRTDDVDNPHSDVRSGLEEYERSGEHKPAFMLTRTEMKLLGIAGVGFFLDGASVLLVCKIIRLTKVF